MKKESKFTITIPTGSPYLILAVGIVYGLRVGLETLAMFVVLGTILENWKVFK
jgi:hypothetical protein